MASAKMHPKLVKFQKAIENRTKLSSDLFVKPSFKLDYINTGSTVLNMLIGGSQLPDGHFVCPGYPRGAIIEIYGQESSGKSTLALTALGQTIYNEGKNDGCGLYVDLECAVKDYYAIKLGADFRSPELGGSGQAMRAQPRTFEETEGLVINAALNGIDLIVIDSVAGLVSTREVKRDVTNEKEKQGVAEIPRLMAIFLPKLQNICSRTKTTVIFLNQTRDKIGAMGYSDEALKTTTGGNSLKFWSAIRLYLKPRQKTKAKVWNPIIKDFEEVAISTDIEVKMIKNKVDAKQGHSGLITIRYGIGVDEIRTMLNVAEAYDIVKMTKNARKQEVYTFKSESGSAIEAIGIEKFRAELQKSSYMPELIKRSQVKLIEGYKMLSDEQLADLAETTKEDHEDYDEAEYIDTSKPTVIDYTDVIDSESTVDPTSISEIDI